EWWWVGGGRLGAEVLAQGGGRDLGGGGAFGQAEDAFEVVGGGFDDVDRGVGVVDPVDGDFVGAQAGALGEDEEFGVEEPAGVQDVGEQLAGDVGADGFEAALGVAEFRGEGAFEDQVVAAGNELALRAADDAGAFGEAAADGQVRVTGQQRRDERAERGEVGGQVHVHVGQHGGVGG